MTDAETREKQQALAARMDAGEIFTRSKSGVCPICGRPFSVRTSKKARITCGAPECFRIFMGARILSKSDKGGRPKKPRPPRAPCDAVSRAREPAKREFYRAPKTSLIQGDPWIVKTLEGYERTADPAWGF